MALSLSLSLSWPAGSNGAGFLPCICHFYRLKDVLHSEQKLYLVFEYLDQDLKKYIDMRRASGGMSGSEVKVY